jgi:hypothetical protein
MIENNQARARAEALFATGAQTQTGGDLEWANYQRNQEIIREKNGPPSEPSPLSRRGSGSSSAPSGTPPVR